MKAQDFTNGMTVYGVKCGEFKVVGVRLIAGGEITIIDVKKVQPDGKLGRKVGMTPECFKASK